MEIMKIKTTQIIKKLKPNTSNYRIRVKNQIKLGQNLPTASGGDSTCLIIVTTKKK